MIAYEQLEVYQRALDFVELSLKTIGQLPAGYAELRSQWKRAAFSIALNIAEGAGKSGIGDKRRFYEIAKGSAMESGAICDILYRAKVLDAQDHQVLKTLLYRIVSMLSKMCLNLRPANQIPQGRHRSCKPNAR